MILKKLDKPYVIAEIGCNHNGDTNIGLQKIVEQMLSNFNILQKIIYLQVTI